MRKMGFGLVGLLLFFGVAGYSEVPVLTEAPVSEFSLPDGTVLTNAYAWRKTSDGMMIMHDGGNYFLIYKTLPPEWQAAYMRPASEEGSVVVEEAQEPVKEAVETGQDRYGIASKLEMVPLLEAESRRLLLNAPSGTEMDRWLLTIGVLQSLLDADVATAKRLYLFMEEQGYNQKEVSEEKLYEACTRCGGDGSLERTCKTCSGTGKCVRCGGTGQRKSVIDGSLMHCTTCRGTGKCPECQGAKQFVSRCPVCSGVGRVLAENYCQILRNRLIRLANAEAFPERSVTIMRGQHEFIAPILRSIPGLKAEAYEYYASAAYDGGRDVDLLAVCFIYSLLEEKFDQMMRVRLIMELECEAADLLELERYAHRCKACGGSGVSMRDCSVCKGSGKCPRCDGTGERTLEIGDDKVYCTTCKGTGVCVECHGAGERAIRCSICGGRGVEIDRARSEIKMTLLLERLNAPPPSVEELSESVESIDE